MPEAGVSAALNAMGYKGIHRWHGYRATHLEERAAMLQVWADYLDKLAIGGEVVPLRAAAQRATNG